MSRQNETDMVKYKQISKNQHKMKEINRKQYIQKITDALNNKQIAVLIGSRRVGKTFLSKKFLHKNAVYIDFEQIKDNYFSNGQEFINYIKARYPNKQKITRLILDEVQHIKNITSILKDLHDNYAFEIIATGSGSLGIYQKLNESLAGRKRIIYIYPISLKEYLDFLGINIDCQTIHPVIIKELLPIVYEFVKWGGYPQVVLAKNESEKYEVLQDIIESYLTIDMLDIINHKELTQFRKVLGMVALHTTSLIKIERIMHELQISKHFVQKYLDLLTKSLFTYPVSPFYLLAPREIKKHKKIYFLDTGVLHYFLQDFSLLHIGKSIETFVLAELVKNLSVHKKLYFWKKRGGAEVDFIIKNIITGKLTAIEVKSNTLTYVPSAIKSFVNTYLHKLSNVVILNKEFVKQVSLRGVPCRFTWWGCGGMM